MQFAFDAFNSASFLRMTLRSGMALHIAAVVACAMVKPPTVAIVGAQGRLGRELVQQSLYRGWSSIAVVRRPFDPVVAPIRKGLLSPDADDSARLLPIQHPKLSVQSSNEDCPRCDAVIFALGEVRFREDKSIDVVSRMCDTMPDTCTQACLVSAYGVGDSLRGSNPGIQVMSAAYLRSAYSSKASQEQMVSSCRATRRLILRPRALTHAQAKFLPGSSRRDLAAEILDWIGEGAFAK